MSREHQAAAVEKLQTLQRLLETQASAAELAPLIEECELLARAVESFHMEAIRFRMHGLHRQLTSGELSVPPESVTLIEETRAALEAAGFKTK